MKLDLSDVLLEKTDLSFSTAMDVSYALNLLSESMLNLDRIM